MDSSFRPGLLIDLGCKRLGGVPQLSSRRRTLAYYFLAAGAAVAMLLLRATLSGEFGIHYPYHTVWLAVIFAGWYCGVGPSILSLVIDSVGIWYWFLPPYHSFTGKTQTEYAGMLGFLVFAGIIVTLGEANRRLFLKQQQTENALQKSNDDLEKRVKERTAELEQSNESARRLSARIIAVQDDERRRIGRSLHDSLGQYLAALKMHLHELQCQGEFARSLASQCSEIVDQCLVETRTVSHLLHPPLLDERGFCSATRLFVEGFAGRSGLAVSLDLPSELAIRMAPDLEIALFRAVQEGLTNIHRYASATAAKIAFRVEPSSVRLAISDNGKGMPLSLLKQIREGTADAGVGIAGIRERFRDLNGALEIESSSSGTTLTITAPLVVIAPESQPLGFSQLQAGLPEPRSEYSA